VTVLLWHSLIADIIIHSSYIFRVTIILINIIIRLFLCCNVCMPVCSLRLFQNFESFRVLVCGGDGSVSWVLYEIDRLGLQKQVQCRPSSIIFTKIKYIIRRNIVYVAA